MMNIIEVVGIIVGLAIISIETYVIFLLNKHIQELDNHTQFLEKSFSQHIDNLDAHVERIEKRVEFLCSCINRVPEKE